MSTDDHGQPPDTADRLDGPAGARLQAEINQGLADLERGAFADDQADELPKLGERIKTAGRERLAKKR